MIYESDFGRDSPRNGSATSLNRAIVDADDFNFNRAQLNAPFKNNMHQKMIFEAKFTPVLPTDDHGKNDFDEEEEEQKVVKFLTEHSKHHEWKTNLPEPTIRKQKPKAEKTSRKDRLEREIVKLILKETPHFDLRDLKFEKQDFCELSPSDILRDLGESSDPTPRPPGRLSETNQGKDADRDSSVNTGPTGNDKFEFLSLGKSQSRASDSDIFNFNNQDDEWAVFDDSSMMNVPLLPSQELDENAFRVSFGSEIGGDAKTKGEFESAEDVFSSESVVKSSEKKESEKHKTQVPFSRDNIIAVPDSSSNTVYLTGSPSVSSCRFEVPQSPSSVTKFSPEERKSPGRKTTGSSAKKCQTGAYSITGPKLSWNPKPPKHYNQIGNAI